MGLAVAGVDGYERDFLTAQGGAVDRVQHNWYQGWFPSACSGYISLLLGLRGSSQVVSTGCSSSIDALGMAFTAIRDGWEDIALGRRNGSANYALVSQFILRHEGAIYAK